MTHYAILFWNIAFLNNFDRDYTLIPEDFKYPPARFWKFHHLPIMQEKPAKVIHSEDEALPSTSAKTVEADFRVRS